MNAKQIEAYNYYKKLKPEALIVFHIPGRYVFLGEDVLRATKSSNHIIESEIDVGILPDDILALSELGSDGSEICLIEYRNAEGLLDFPDINKLKDEQEMDF